MPQAFQPTRWSLIQEAGSTDPDRRNQAWEDFDALYREPLFNFIRRTGWNTEESEDLLQSFLAKLADRQWLQEADRERGKMRTFLLGRLKGHLGDARKRAMAQKRGGEAFNISADEIELPESRDPSAQDRTFDREWARAILDRTMIGLKAEAQSKERDEIFNLLKNQITSESPQQLSEAAAKLGQSEGAVRMQLQRLREKFRIRLRAEVAETLLPEEDVSSEMRYLAEVLADGR